MTTTYLRQHLACIPEISNLKVAPKAPGKTPLYQLSDFWSLNLYDFVASVELNGELVRISPGMVCLMPPETRRRFHYPSRIMHRVCHFRVEGVDSAKNLEPVMFEYGDGFESLLVMFDQAVSHMASQPVRAQAEIWTLLWKLSDHVPDSPHPHTAKHHPVVEELMRRIETRLGEPFRIAALLHGLPMSHNHVIRLFQSRFGKSIAQYVRMRRMNMARHLLAHTDLPVKVIACEVGIPDIHLFNKTIRRELGLSPRKYRESMRNT